MVLLTIDTNVGLLFLALAGIALKFVATTKVKNLKGMIFGIICSGLLFACAKPTTANTAAEYNNASSEYYVSPTNQQAYYYATQSGGYVFILVASIVAIVALALFAIGIVGNKFMDSQNQRTNMLVKIIAGVAIALIVFLGIDGKPSTIRSRNSKPLTEAQYKAYQQAPVAFWDSIYNNNRMLGAAK